MFLAAALFLGILTLWVPARWGLTVFQLAIFFLAVWRIVLRIRAGTPLGKHPVAMLFAAVAGWGLVQLAAGWSVDPYRTAEEVLNWTVNLAAFSLALELASDARPAQRFLDAVLWFGAGLAAVAMLTVFSSPPGVIAWWFDTGTGLPTLGPFVYRNQYAAFVEVILPLALVRALFDPARRVLYMLVAALLFASVVAGGSRAGTLLCLAEVLLIPAIAYARALVSRRTLLRVTAGSLLSLAALTAVAGWQPIWERLREPNPYALRADLTRSSLAMIADRPLTGFGLGAWPAAYPGYARYDDGRFVNQAHNDWAQWAAEGGIPMLVAMLAAFGWTIRRASGGLWGLGILTLALHCLVDYPMQQRPALAAFFCAMLGVVCASQTVQRQPDSRSELD